MLEWALISALWLGGADSDTACAVYWRDMTGYGWEEHLAVPPVSSLRHLADNEPSWWPDQYDDGGHFTRKASRGELQWSPATEPGRTEILASIDGRQLYSVSYAPQTHLLVWERRPGSFCVFALLQGNGTVVGRVSKLRVFSWGGRAVATTRIFYSGMGALQESLFFAIRDGTLVHLREGGALAEYIAKHKIVVHHRNGGFCNETLVWQNWAGYDDDEARSGTVVLRAEYAIDGDRLRIKSVGLVRAEKGKTDCEAYPRE